MIFVPLCSCRPDSRTQLVNANQRIKATGTRLHRRQISEASIGIATMIQVNALTPSAHHTGKATNSTTNGQVTGSRGRPTAVQVRPEQRSGNPLAPGPAAVREQAAHVSAPLARGRRWHRQGRHSASGVL